MADKRGKINAYGQAGGESRSTAYASDYRREKAAGARNLKKTRRLRARIQQRRRRSRIYMTITCAAAAVIAIVALSVFFNISEIEVTGCERYTPGQIIAASGIKKGDNLLLMNKFAVIDRMLEKLVYLRGVEIRRVFPDKLRITVTETSSVLAFESSGGWWLADADGRLLEFSASLGPNAVSIKGVDLITPAVGQAFSAGDADIPLYELLSALSEHNLLEGTSLIDMSRLYNSYFIHKGYTVIVGKSGGYSESCRLVAAAISDLSAAGVERATLDISTGTLSIKEER